ncbi:MAG: hypothetical protein U1A27_00185 [Phycisphaerae bacterium]
MHTYEIKIFSPDGTSHMSGTGRIAGGADGTVPDHFLAAVQHLAFAFLPKDDPDRSDGISQVQVDVDQANAQL